MSIHLRKTKKSVVKHKVTYIATGDAFTPGRNVRETIAKYEGSVPVAVSSSSGASSSSSSPPVVSLGTSSLPPTTGSGSSRTILTHPIVGLGLGLSAGASSPAVTSPAHRSVGVATERSGGDCFTWKPSSTDDAVVSSGHTGRDDALGTGISGPSHPATSSSRPTCSSHPATSTTAFGVEVGRKRTAAGTTACKSRVVLVKLEKLGCKHAPTVGDSSSVIPNLPSSPSSPVLVKLEKLGPLGPRLQPGQPFYLNPQHGFVQPVQKKQNRTVIIPSTPSVGAGEPRQLEQQHPTVIFQQPPGTLQHGQQQPRTLQPPSSLMPPPAQVTSTLPELGEEGIVGEEEPASGRGEGEGTGSPDMGQKPPAPDMTPETLESTGEALAEVELQQPLDFLAKKKESPITTQQRRLPSTELGASSPPLALQSTSALLPPSLGPVQQAQPLVVVQSSVSVVQSSALQPSSDQSSALQPSQPSSDQSSALQPSSEQSAMESDQPSSSAELSLLDQVHSSAPSVMPELSAELESFMSAPMDISLTGTMDDMQFPPLAAGHCRLQEEEMDITPPPPPPPSSVAPPAPSVSPQHVVNASQLADPVDANMPACFDQYNTMFGYYPRVPRSQIELHILLTNFDLFIENAEIETNDLDGVEHFLADVKAFSDSIPPGQVMTFGTCGRPAFPQLTKFRDREEKPTAPVQTVDSSSDTVLPTTPATLDQVNTSSTISAAVSDNSKQGDSDMTPSCSKKMKCSSAHPSAQTQGPHGLATDRQSQQTQGPHGLATDRQSQQRKTQRLDDPAVMVTLR